MPLTINPPAVTPAAVQVQPPTITPPAIIVPDTQMVAALTAEGYKVTAPGVTTPPPASAGHPTVSFYPGSAGNPSGQTALAAQYAPNLPFAYCDGAVYDTWADVDNSVSWLAGLEKPSAMFPLPLCLTGQTLAQAVASNSGVFTTIGQKMIAAGIHPATSPQRLAWEFSGTWYPDSAGNDPADFLTAYMRAAKELKLLGFPVFWCAANRSAPFEGQKALQPLDLYPGDAYVDVIGTDLYEQSWVVKANNAPTASQLAAAMDDIMNGAWGLNPMIAFAESRNKPFGLGELGLAYRPDGYGMGDDPTFLPTIFSAIKACTTGVSNIEYFNGSDGSVFSALGANGYFPKATAGAPAAFATL